MASEGGGEEAPAPNLDDPREAVVELTRALVETPSENPPGDEKGVADLLAARLQASPVAFDVEQYDVHDGRPNVVATTVVGGEERGSDGEGGTLEGATAAGTDRVGDGTRDSSGATGDELDEAESNGASGGKHVLLTGHTDVVPATPEKWSGDPFTLRREDGRLIGRGVSDMKASLAAKVVATEQYVAGRGSHRKPTEGPGRPSRITLAFVADEESSGAGTEALIERGIDADVAIIGEPTRCQVCIAQKGATRYGLSIGGRSAHSGTPDEGANAITGVSQFLGAVERFDDERRAATAHPHLEPETVTVTEVESGIAPNVVPDAASVTVDWRTHPATSLDPDGVDERFERLVAAVAAECPDLSFEVERIVTARGVEIDEEHELVKSVVEAARAAGVDCEPVGFNAATDARFLVHDADIPTVLFGPGSIEDDAHTVDESIAEDALVDTVHTYTNVLERFCG